MPHSSRDWELKCQKEQVSNYLTKTEKSFLRLAEKVAESSTMKQRHGAVIVKSGRVMSVGINKWRNHPEIIEAEKIKQECSVHAEIDALSRVKNPRGATIYIARVNRLGESGLSRPCNNCFQDLVKSGINKIIYT